MFCNDGTVLGREGEREGKRGMGGTGIDRFRAARPTERVKKAAAENEGETQAGKLEIFYGIISTMNSDRLSESFALVRKIRLWVADNQQRKKS